MPPKGVLRFRGDRERPPGALRLSRTWANRRSRSCSTLLRSFAAFALPSDALLGPSTMNIGTICGRPRAQRDRRLRQSGDSRAAGGRSGAHPTIVFGRRGRPRGVEGDSDDSGHRVSSRRRDSDDGRFVHDGRAHVRRRLGAAAACSGRAAFTWRTRRKSASPSAICLQAVDLYADAVQRLVADMLKSVNSVRFDHRCANQQAPRPAFLPLPLPLPLPFSVAVAVALPGARLFDFKGRVFDFPVWRQNCHDGKPAPQAPEFRTRGNSTGGAVDPPGVCFSLSS